MIAIQKLWTWLIEDRGNRDLAVEPWLHEWTETSQWGKELRHREHVSHWGAVVRAKRQWR